MPNAFRILNFKYPEASHNILQISMKGDSG